MRRFSKVLTAAAVFFLCALSISAQNTTVVSGTVQDSNGTPYSFATVQAQLIPSGITPTIPPPCNGQSSTPCSVSIFTSGNTDAAGNFSMNLASNAVLSPAGTQWQFSINEIGSPLPIGTGPQVCNATLTISGASQSVSASFAACPKLSNVSATPGCTPLGVNGAMQVNNAGLCAAGAIHDSSGALQATEPMHWQGPDPWVDLSQYVQVSTSTNSTTATCTAASTSVTLAAAIDFANPLPMGQQQGSVLYGCGPATPLATPAAPSTVTPLGISGGSTTYTYQVAGEDSFGGLTAAGPATSTTTGATTLGQNCVNISSISRVSGVTTVTTSAVHHFINTSRFKITGTAGGAFDGVNVMTAASGSSVTFQQPEQTDLSGGAAGQICVAARNRVQWPAQSPPPVRWWIYRNGALAGVEQDPEPTWDDFGNTAPNAPYIPATPPAVATPQQLITSIVSGAGTVNLVVADAASSSNSGVMAMHDNTKGFLAAYTAAHSSAQNGGILRFPHLDSAIVFNAWVNIPQISPAPTLQLGTPLSISQPFYIGQNVGFRLIGINSAGSPASFDPSYTAHISSTSYPGFLNVICTNVIYDHLLISSTAAQSGSLIFSGLPGLGGCTTVTVTNSHILASAGSNQMALMTRGNTFGWKVEDNTFEIGGAGRFFDYAAFRITSSNVESPVTVGFGIAFLNRNSFIGQGLGADNDAGVVAAANGIQNVYVRNFFSESLYGPAISIDYGTNPGLGNQGLVFDGVDNADTTSGCMTPAIEMTNAYNVNTYVANVWGSCTQPAVAGNFSGSWILSGYFPNNGFSSRYARIGGTLAAGIGMTVKSGGVFLSGTNPRLTGGQIADPLVAPTVAVTTVGCTGFPPAGTHTYKVAFGDVFGTPAGGTDLTKPSPASVGATVDGTTQCVQITPASIPVGAVIWVVYRDGAAININSCNPVSVLTTTQVDQVSSLCGSSPNTQNLSGLHLATPLGYYGGVIASTYGSIENCNFNGASPATCFSAPMGVVVVPTTTTTYTVNTTVVTNSSRISIYPTTDATGITGTPTCNAPPTPFVAYPTSRVAGTSFTFTLPSTTGTSCWYYEIKN